MVVLAISVTLEAKLLTADDCHLVTSPVLLPKVRVVLLVPVQTVVLPEMVPPTDTGLTVTVTEARDADGQEAAFHDRTT